MKILNKIPQYTRNKRHIQSIITHGNAFKLWNIVRVEIERKMRRIKTSGRPYILILDPCNYCNLKCPLCPTGTSSLNREQCVMTFYEFKKIFDKFSDYLLEVNLHNWGEPFINKDIFKMIEYARKKNVGTNLSTNFVIPKSSDIDNIIDSGLEYLIVSLDAVTPEVYDKYRVHGDFNRVIENLSLLLKRRREKKCRTPIVEWQFIVMKTNEHQVKEAEAMATKLGVDIMRFIPVGLPFDAPDKKNLADKWFPGGKTIDSQDESVKIGQYGQTIRSEPCYYLYRSITIHPDGGIAPCCIVYDKKYDAGMIWGTSLDEIWNNDYYRSARSLFSGNDFKLLKSTPCRKCNIFKKYK